MYKHVLLALSYGAWAEISRHRHLAAYSGVISCGNKIRNCLFSKRRCQFEEVERKKFRTAMMILQLTRAMIGRRFKL
jgi:hypothetical protein